MLSFKSVYTIQRVWSLFKKLSCNTQGPLLVVDTIISKKKNNKRKELSILRYYPIAPIVSRIKSFSWPQIQARFHWVS